MTENCNLKHCLLEMWEKGHHDFFELDQFQIQIQFYKNSTTQIMYYVKILFKNQRRYVILGTL